MTELVQVSNGATDMDAVMDRVMVAGDLSQLSAGQRLEYYSRTCSSLGLNALTKPFAYIKLNGKVVLYALRDCADQLRRIHKVSIEIVDRKISNGLLTIHVRAKMPDGRQDEDVGVLAWNDNLAGEAAANTLMKGITKAKRRVTLSICGLGILDETEVHTIPDAEFVEFTDNGEVVVTAKTEPSKWKSKTKRKSASQAKKDGDYDNLFKPISEALKQANEVGAEALKEVWGRYEKVLEWFPSDWHDLLASEYMDAMEANGEEVKIVLIGGKM